jgi:hypothetical protein
MKARPEITGRTAVIGHNGGPPLPEWIELQRVISLGEVSRRTSTDSRRRHYSDKIIALSPRRVGMRLRDALAIGEN